MTEGCIILRVEKSPGDKRAFVHFADPDKCERLIQNYWNGTAKTSVRSYVDNLRRAKDLIYSTVGR
jgi:hypothetical protein